MSNIIVKDSIYRDPFTQSDRKGGFGINGKGDAPRTTPTEDFRKEIERIFPKREKLPGGKFRKTYK